MAVCNNQLSIIIPEETQDCKHMFQFRIGGNWYRHDRILNDTELDIIMDLINWRLPFNMKVFHWMGELNNEIVLERPIMEANIAELFTKEPDHMFYITRGKYKSKKKVFRQSGKLLLSESIYEEYWSFFTFDDQELQIAGPYEPVPIAFRQARVIVDKHHRHNSAPQNHKFSIGLRIAGTEKLAGVVMTSHPIARNLDNGRTLEIRRVCLLGPYANACSMLYGLALRAGKAMGYTRFITYTLDSEPGISVKAAGFHFDGFTADDVSWNRKGRARSTLRRYPEGRKKRWVQVI